MASGMIPNDLAKMAYLPGTYTVTNNPIFGRVGTGNNNKQRITFYANPIKSLAMASNVTVTKVESLVIYCSTSGYKNIGTTTSEIVTYGIRGGYALCGCDRSSYGLTNNVIFVGTASITFTVS